MHGVSHQGPHRLPGRHVGGDPGPAYRDLDRMRHLPRRFRRPDLGHLEREITFDDSTAFTKPWTLKRVSSLAPKNIDVLEYVCAENNKDVEHLVGR